MIIKIDHITICSADFESDLNYFSNLGFKINILNQKLKNLEIKSELMKNFCEYQKFALLESKNNLDIDLQNAPTLASLAISYRSLDKSTNIFHPNVRIR